MMATMTHCSLINIMSVPQIQKNVVKIIRYTSNVDTEGLSTVHGWLIQTQMWLVSTGLSKCL